MFKKNVIIFLFFSPFLISCQTIRKVKLFSVSGTITQNYSYCGGMAPSPEMIEERNRYVPYSKKILYVRKGATNNLKNSIVLKFISDSLGNFSFNLASGIYSIIQTNQVKKLNINSFFGGPSTQVDTTCLQKWWKEPLQILDIKDKNITGLNFNFHRQCFVSSDVPCINYIGPMPP